MRRSLARSSGRTSTFVLAATAVISGIGSFAATTLTVNVPKTIKPCSPATISWDASTGKAPWTITVAPVDGLPESVTVPANYMTSKTWSWDWNVPAFSDPTSQQVIVAISDSTGAVAGSSSLLTLSPGTSTSCTAPATDLDFVWFPEERAPRECDEWKITWQEDRGNSGIVSPVQFAVIPENGIPLAYSAGARDKTWDMQVQLSAGTRFVVAAFDNGKSGTGGVGQVYTVRSHKCGLVGGLAASPGLVKSNKVATAPAAKTTTSSGGKSKSTSSTSSNSSGNSKNNSSSNDDDDASSSSNESHSNVGAIAGGVIGALAGIAVLIGLIWWFWRRRAESAPSQRKWPGGEVMPWKWEVVDEKPRGDDEDAGTRSFQVLGGSHLRRPSQDPNWPPTMTTAQQQQQQHVRQQSQPGAQYMNVMASTGSDPASRHVSKPSLSTRNVFSVVPDDALFPPPAPGDRHDGGGGSHAPSLVPGQRYPSQLERPPQSKVVSDAMLFPRPNGGQSYEGHGSADRIAMSPMRQQSQGHPPPYSQPRVQNPLYNGSGPTSRQVYPQQPQREASSSSTSSSSPKRKKAPQGNTAPSPQHTHYIPPPQPVKTSIHDPYSHMSRVYSPTTVKKALHKRDFSQDAAGRLPPAQYPGSRGSAGGNNGASAEPRVSLGEDFTLPYLK